MEERRLKINGFANDCNSYVDNSMIYSSSRLTPQIIWMALKHLSLNKVREGFWSKIG